MAVDWLAQDVTLVSLAVVIVAGLIAMPIQHLRGMVPPNTRFTTLSIRGIVQAAVAAWVPKGGGLNGLILEIQ